jgi:hypothetical protein
MYVIAMTSNMIHKRIVPKNTMYILLAVLVMGLSLVIVVALWFWFGHIGPSYSANVMIKQQQTLRRRYDLPPKPVITNPKILQIPPSLRPSEYKNCIPYSFC